MNEIIERFPDVKITRTILSTSGLLRKIGIKDIEEDIKRWGVNMVLLADKMAIHAASTVYCLKNDIEFLYDGVVNYQSDLVEQKKIAMDKFKEFEAAYNINYESPIYNFGNRKEIKYALLDFGISNKSLEGVSIFGDSFSEPEDWMIKEYMDEKFHFCHEYIRLMMNGTYGESK